MTNNIFHKIQESPGRLTLILAACCTAVVILFMTMDSERVLEQPRILKVTDIPNDSRMSTHIGGLGAIREKDEEVTNVVEKIKPVLEEKTGLKFESLEVIHYKPQTVAGRNYFVKAKAKPVGGDEQIVHLRIYQDLKREVSLTDYQLGKTLEDKMEYF